MEKIWSSFTFFFFVCLNKAKKISINEGRKEGMKDGRRGGKRRGRKARRSMYAVASTEMK